MKHLGDITKINGAEIEPVWCITGGSPCQDLSVAGKRKGLKHSDLGDGETTRSGLFMEQVRIVKEMRERDRRAGRPDELVRPRFLVWENVPGAFSSNFKDGFGDFGAVLEEIVRIAEPTFSLPRLQGKQKWTKSGALDGDGWSIAWRTHDAQYWGVPQRRRRISIVADFGGKCAGEISFERKGVSGNPEQGEPKRKETSGDPAEGSGVNDCVAIEGNGQRESHRGDGWKLTDKMYTLNTTEVHGVAYGVEPCAASRLGGYFYENISGTLRSTMGDNQMSVAYSLDCRNASVNEELSATLQAKGNGGFSYNCINPVAYCNDVSHALKAKANLQFRDDSEDYVVEPIPYTLQIRSGCEGGGKGALIQEDKVAALTTVQTHTLFQPVTYQDVTGCLSPGAHPGSYNGQDAYNDMLVTEKKCYGICSYESNSMKSGNPNSGIYEAETSRTLDLNGGNPSCNQGGVAVCEPVTFEGAGVTSPQNKQNPKPGVCHTLNQDSRNYLVEPNIYDMTHPCDVIRDCGHISPVLKARMGTGGNQVPITVQRIIRWIVRRLTPTECERLQGYPDHWTDIGDWVDSKGKKHKGDADSPRYKALGNSIALPFWYWMFCRMAKYLPEDATLGSLFDGIGGFPACWEAIHGKGTARWASEIEEFPIAVTKMRFPEEE